MLPPGFPEDALRRELAGRFLHCATGHAQGTHQLRARRLPMAAPGLGRPLPDGGLIPEELRAADVLFASVPDERQRRLFGGLVIARIEALMTHETAGAASAVQRGDTPPPRESTLARPATKRRHSHRS